MKNYYSIEGTLYTLTSKQVKEIQKNHPEPSQENNEWNEYLDAIVRAGKQIGYCTNLNY